MLGLVLQYMKDAYFDVFHMQTVFHNTLSINCNSIVLGLLSMAKHTLQHSHLNYSSILHNSSNLNKTKNISMIDQIY